MGLISNKIKASKDDHIWITLECPDSPIVSLDIANEHGRRTLSIRVNGMGIGGHLLDVAQLPPSHLEPERLRRYCPYCGL